MSQYPECDKLAAISKESQSIGEFIEWLQQEKGVRLAHYGMKEKWCSCPGFNVFGGDEFKDCPKCKGTHFQQNEDGTPVLIKSETLMSYPKNTEGLLAEFFKIDMNKVEEERRAMLKSIRKVS